MYGIRRFFNRFLYYYLLRDSVKCARKLGVTIGEGCRVLDDPAKVFGSEPWLVSVGNKCEFTNGVRIITHEGGLWVARNLCDELKKSDVLKPVSIGNNVMIGNYSLIMPGVKIGDNVIVGGHSVVTHDCESDRVYAGIPAREINKIDIFVEKIKNSSDRYDDTKEMPQDQKMKIVIERLAREGR